MITPVSGSTPPQKLKPSLQVTTCPLASFFTNSIDFGVVFLVTTNLWL